ncbi:RES family NAD+ phosphorylase [Bacillus thuringiensis]|uniref:RES family NAD+ phosphorylase n=1 Tax=Bacillus thuringiensis TaxID=1428 RepID=UPI003459FA8A
MKKNRGSQSDALKPLSVASQLKIAENTIKPFSIASQLKIAENTIKPFSIASQLKIAENTIKPFSVASQLKIAENTIKPFSVASQLKIAENTIKPLNVASQLKLRSASSNWVLANPVIKEMSLINDYEDSRYIFNKISKDDYVITQDYQEEDNDLEYLIENKITNETIPVKDIPSTLAITDIITDLDVSDVVSLYNHLIKYPMLGLEHEVGRRIFDEIKLMEFSEFEDLNLFRVRQRNPIDREAPFTELEMFEAPYGFAGHGRFNVNGQGELYTCESKEVALKEIASNNSNYRYEIINWKLTQQVKLLDFSNVESPLVRYCSFQKKTKNGHEYILPNFIAQCVKYHQIAGIKFSSVVEPGILNYVFFDFETNWFKTVKMENDIKYEMGNLQKV